MCSRELSSQTLLAQPRHVVEGDQGLKTWITQRRRDRSDAPYPTVHCDDHGCRRRRWSQGTSQADGRRKGKPLKKANAPTLPRVAAIESNGQNHGNG
jgi:hypothetical protein